MTFRITSGEHALFFCVAFGIVAIIFFYGPRRRRADAVWFGLASLSLSIYAAVAFTLEPPWPMITAGVAAVFGVIGLVCRMLRRK